MNLMKLDCSIESHKLFFERFDENEEPSLSLLTTYLVFSAFRADGFDALCTACRRTQGVLDAPSMLELFLNILKERQRLVVCIMNVKPPFTLVLQGQGEPVLSIIKEITLPVDPIQHIDDDAGEIALCILSAINVGKIRSHNELEELCDLAVRGLEELIDYQKYPVAAAERSTLSRRSLGIGYIGLVHYLATRIWHDDPAALSEVHRLTEAFQYNLLVASNQLAKEKGQCDGFPVQNMLMEFF